MNNDMIMGLLGGVGISIAVFLIGLLTTGAVSAAKTAGKEANKLIDKLPEGVRGDVRKMMITFLDTLEKELCENHEVLGNYAIVSNDAVKHVVNETKNKVDIGLGWNEKQGINADARIKIEL